MRHNPLDKRYLEDVNFKRLVDQIYYLVVKQDSSFQEVREAVLFAQLKFELERPVPPIFFSPELDAELRRRMEAQRTSVPGEIREKW